MHLGVITNETKVAHVISYKVKHKHRAAAAAARWAGGAGRHGAGMVLLLFHVC